jgi:hypothetical protein
MLSSILNSRKIPLFLTIQLQISSFSPGRIDKNHSWFCVSRRGLLCSNQTLFHVIAFLPRCRAKRPGYFFPLFPNGVSWNFATEEKQFKRLCSAFSRRRTHICFEHANIRAREKPKSTLMRVRNHQRSIRPSHTHRSVPP